MIKYGILHRLILIIAIFLNSFFDLIYKNKDDLELFNWILFAFIILFLGIFILVPELKILFKRQKIARIKRFDYRNLVFLIVIIPSLLLADYKTINTGLMNLDSNFYNAFLWLTIMFLRRDNYFIITNKWIRYRGFDLIMDSTKINLKNIIEIEEKDDVFVFKSDSKELEIDINKILKVDRKVFEDELNKLRNTVYNNVLKQ